jgi:hypothetical protein
MKSEMPSMTSYTSTGDGNATEKPPTLSGNGQVDPQLQSAVVAAGNKNSEMKSVDKGSTTNGNSVNENFN